jgi:hypothetical protein
MNNQEDLDALKTRLNSANNTIMQQLQVIEQYRIQNMVLTMQGKQYETSKELQDKIIQNTLNEVNERNNRYLEEINELKAELRKLKVS